MMDSSHILISVLGTILLAILLFTLFKGVIRMLLLAVAVIGAIAVWMLIQRNGFTFLSFVVTSPRPWMVQACAWIAALFTFAVFHHGMRWFSLLFSFRKAGPGSIITTILMSLVMLWVATLGISYYSDICRISYYHDLAEAQLSGQPGPQLPWIISVKESLRRSRYTAWLEKIDPIENPAQANLACLIAYGCTLDEPSYTAFYLNMLAPRGIPQPTRFLDLFSDPGLRTLVAEKRFVTLLENERLMSFLQFRNTEEHIRYIL